MANELALPDDLQKALAEQASTENSREPNSTSTVISTRGKKFRIGDEQLPDELLVVVAGAAFENAWFDRAYDPNNTTPPACFALSLDEDEMSYHEDSPVPQKASVNAVKSASGSTLHLVLKGETVYRICQKYGITAEQLFEWNNLKNNDIFAGQKLKIAE